MTDDFLLRQQIIEAAVARYMDDGDGFTIDRIAEDAGVTPEAVDALFENKYAILPAYYDLCLERYRAFWEDLDGADAFTLEERVATFVFVMFDFFEEHRAFVAETFDRHVVRPWASSFRKGVARVFADFLDAGEVPMENRFVAGREPVHRFLAGRYLWLVGVWLADETPGRAEATALSDKLAGFFAELATFRGIERGVDLAKYLYEIGRLRVPFADRFFKQEQETEDG